MADRPSPSRERTVPAPPAPTPVASGISPVTPGDLTYVVERLRQLPREMLLWLALGSLPGDSCRVCDVLREGTYPPPHPVAAELVEWHGNDAIRCGVIYGAAYVVFWEARGDV